jgi:dTDP-4-amino-4,6-dideoxygalactose transaminase
MSERIPFNRPYSVGTEHGYMREALENAHLSADGEFSRRCAEWLQEQTGADLALMVHSCTAALEMSVLLAGVGPGDEVILPSFTFPSTATAVAMRGATPVFVDVRADTLNLDETLVEAAITPATKAIMPVHYAGVGADMDQICAIAAAHGVLVIEDAAQGIRATQGGRPLGGIGQLGALSFHETKNVTCGEGGALLVNDPALRERAEMLRDKGTDRARFFRGEVPSYSWVDLGSSYAMSDLNAAFLWGQLQHAARITERRLEIWHTYHDAFAGPEQAGWLRRPVVPADASHNAHIYYMQLDSRADRDAVLARLAERGVNAVFHYQPLHSSPAGQRFGRTSGALPVTERAGACLLRLPLWMGMRDAQVERVIDATLEAIGSREAWAA